MKSVIERLDDEIKELEGRLLKLESFLDSGRTIEVSKIQFSYLRIQRNAMRTYLTVLIDRIVDLRNQ